jgi:uncharacterized membrane protein
MTRKLLTPKDLFNQKKSVTKNRKMKVTLTLTKAISSTSLTNIQHYYTIAIFQLLSFYVVRCCFQQRIIL